MKRLAVFIGSLLVLPAFAEVAPVVFEDFEYADVVYDADGNPILLTEYTDADADVDENIIMPSVPSTRGGTATRANTNRTTIGRTIPTASSGAASTRASAANSSRAVAARATSNSSPRTAANSRSVSSRSTTSRTTSTAATRTATNAAATNAAAARATGGAGRATSTRTASGAGTVARTATTSRATSSRTASGGARVNRASTNAAVAANSPFIGPAAPIRLSGTTTITGNSTLTDGGTPLYLANGASSRVSVANRVPTIRMSSISGLSTDTSSVSVTAADLSAMDELAEMTDYCKAQYAACMDNYCNVLDDNQGRCSCSANINNYAKAETALKQATEELQEVAQKIQYIGLSAREVQTLFTATEAELEMQKTTDTTQLKASLDKIRDMIIDVQSGNATTTSSSSFLSFDLSGLLDFTIDSTGFDLSSFLGGFGTNSGGINNQRGAQLFQTATNRCKTNVLRACTAAGVDASLVTNAYDLEIDKECIAYERSLNDSNDQMVATVRNAKSVLQKARLLVEQSKNEYDMRGCINALDSCMQDEYVCGSDYEKCLDPSGRYIVNGEIVIGTDPGRAVNGVNDTGVLDGNICSMNLYNVWNYGSSTPGQTTSQSSCTNAWNSYSLNSGNGDLAAYINETVSLANAKAGGLGMSQFMQNKIGYNEKDRNYGMCMSVLNKCQDYTYTGNGSTRKYNADNEVVKQYLSRVLVQIKAKQDEILAEHAESCITDVTTCLSQNNYPFDDVNNNRVQANIAINACRSTIVTCMSVNGYSVDDPTPSDLFPWICGITTGTTDCSGNSGSETPVTPTNCTVTYNCNNGNSGGTAPSSQTVSQGSSIVVQSGTSCTAPSGKTFGGWLVGSTTSSTLWPAGSTQTCQSRTLYANWVSGSVTAHNITWRPQQSSVSVPTSCETTYYTSPNVQYKTCAPGSVSGKTFKGWCTNAAGTSGCSTTSQPTRAIIPANSSSDITFYGQWDEATPDWTQINLDDNGGSGSAPNPIYFQSVSGISACPKGYYGTRTCDTSDIWLALEEGIPTRAGCDYRGHFTAENQEVVNDHGEFNQSFVPATRVVTATAQWTGANCGSNDGQHSFSNQTFEGVTGYTTQDGTETALP